MKCSGTLSRFRSFELMNILQILARSRARILCSGKFRQKKREMTEVILRISAVMQMTDDRLKIWLGFGKFFLGTLALGVFSTWISHDLKTRELEIQEILTEALVRLSYGDKTGLYDLEFDYFTDEYSYDNYLTRGEIQYATMDSVDYLEIVGSIVYEDSINLNVYFVFKSSKGTPTKTQNSFTMFKQADGAWKKPTMTSLFLQREYERTIWKADSAAAAEEG